MSAPALAPAAITTAAGGVDITHVYCCDPGVAICGEDLSDTPEVDEDDQLCVVCADLEDQTCNCP